MEDVAIEKSKTIRESWKFTKDMPEMKKLCLTGMKDFNADAKAFPELFCYGYGSYHWKFSRLSLMQHVRSRLLDLDSRFRRHNLYAFFQQDQILKRQLMMQQQIFKFSRDKF